MSEGYICASVLAIAVACAGLVFILRKRRIQPTVFMADFGEVLLGFIVLMNTNEIQATASCSHFYNAYVNRSSKPEPAIVAKVQTTPNTYFGVDIAFQGVNATEQLIDQISNFTNLVVFGSTNTTYDDGSLTQVCHYALQKKLVLLGFHCLEHTSLGCLDCNGQ